RRLPRFGVTLGFGANPLSGGTPCFSPAVPLSGETALSGVTPRRRASAPCGGTPPSGEPPRQWFQKRSQSQSWVKTDVHREPPTGNCCGSPAAFGTANQNVEEAP